MTPPTMMNACKIIEAVSPTAIKELTSDFARAAVTRPRIAKQRYKSSRPAAPSKPVSSAIAAKIKVAFYDRNLVGHAVANANAEQAAIGYGENGLNELISVTGCILERIEPGVNTNLNVVE